MRAAIPGQSFLAAGGVIEERRRLARSDAQTRPGTGGQNDDNRFGSRTTPEYNRLARQFTSVKVPGVASNVEVPGRGGLQLQSLNPTITSRDDDDDNNLSLKTRFTIETPFRPVFDYEQNWSMDDDLGYQITSFEMCSSVSETDLKHALSELMAMVEEDLCDRFYILDEAGLNAAVVCGRNTAFWSGTTSLMRADLMRRGIPYVIPQAKSTTAAEAAEALHELRANTLQTAVHASHLEEVRCTLYFNSTFAVRGLVEAFINMRMDAKLRIIASHPFPGCMMKISRAKLSHKLSAASGASIWTTSFEGYFTVLDTDKVTRAFVRSNDVRNEVNVYQENSPLTIDFDRVARFVFGHQSSPTTTADAEEEFV